MIPPTRRGRRVIAALTAAGLIAVAVLLSLRGPGANRSPSGAVAKRPVRSEQFGANVNRLFEDPSLGADVAVQLAALKATGATVARSDALWEATEPTAPAGGAHRYRWAFDDFVAAALAMHGLRWLPIIDYSPAWARSVPGRDHSPPVSLIDYAAYAAAFAARYGPRGDFWKAHPRLRAAPVSTIEIWNEPDNPQFWFPHPHPARYAALYAAARDAISAAAPSVRAIVGGLSAPESFLPALMRVRPALIGHLDGVAIHAYAPTAAAILAKVATVRHLLDRLGLPRVDLYLTEFGWTTSPPGAYAYVSAGSRPAALAATLAALGDHACGVAVVAVYTWVTAQRDRRDSQQWYGIHPPGGGASAAAQAFTAGVRAATGSAAGKLPCPGG